jgi:hypothetical protein
VKEVSPGSFIYEHEGALSLETCAEIIRLFEENPEDQGEGVTARGVNLDLKISTDIKIHDQPHWAEIDRQLYLSTSKLLAAFPHTEWMHTDGLSDAGYQIQRTNPGGFYGKHYDAQGKGGVALRQLVVLWYLNDDHRGGHTAFPRHGVDISPKAGKALLFPPYWTHMHEGLPVHKGSKYIATTWVS